MGVLDDFKKIDFNILFTYHNKHDFFLVGADAGFFKKYL